MLITDALAAAAPANFADGPARTISFASRLARSYFNNADGTPYRPVFGNNQIEDSQARPQRTRQDLAEVPVRVGAQNGRRHAAAVRGS